MASDIKIIMEVLGKEDMVRAIKLTDTLKSKMDYLAASLQKGKITSSQYTTAVNQLASKNKTLAGGYQVLLGQLMSYNAKSLQTTNALNQQVNAVTRLGNAQVAMGASTQVANRKMNSGSVAMQQFGYQAGDFLVQVQSGTSAMLAFGQQATQLVGILPMVHKQLGLSVGAAVGLAAGLGIAIPLLTAIGGAFLRTRKKAKEAAGGVKTVEEALKNLSESYKDAEASAASFQGIVESFNARQVANGYVVLGEKVGETFGASLMDRALNSLRGFGPDSAEMKAVEDNLQKAFGVYGRGAGDIFGAGFVGQLQEAISTENVEALESIINSLDAFGNRTPIGDRFIQDLIAAVDLMKGYTSEVVKSVDKLEEAVKLGEDLSGTDIKLGVEAAAAAAELLAERLGLSLGAAQRMVGLAQGQGVTGPDGAIGQMRDRFSNGLLRDSIVFQETYEREDPTKTSGGSYKGGSGGQTESEKLAEYLLGKKQELEMQRELIGVFDEERDIQQALLKIKDEYAGVITDAQLKEYEGTLRQMEAVRQLHQIEEDRKALMESIGQTFADGFTAMVEGTMTVKDAFKNMAREIIKQLWEIFVVQQIVGMFTGTSPAVGNMMKGWGLTAANGAALSGGNVIPFASGGVVGSPTMFGMSGGRTGLMGEAGPEAIMPLKRGSDGKLGVQSSGGGQSIVIHQSFNFSANGDETVKNLIAQAAPKIAQMTKSSLLDDRRRGGATKAAFG